MRTAQPNIKRLLAAIQLTATRTTMRAQCAQTDHERSRKPNRDKRGNTNSTKATAAVSDRPIVVPFHQR